MNKLLLAISATFLFTSTMAQAEVKTFNFTFSGVPFDNAANATGYLTIDTALGGPTNYSTLDNNILDLGFTLSGADASLNGFYDLSYYDNVFFIFPDSLDLSYELIGQIASDGTIFGQEGSGRFTLIASNIDLSPTANSDFGLVSIGPTDVNLMRLTSMTPATVAAVPEADTSAMLLTGLGVLGFMARRRNKAKVA